MYVRMNSEVHIGGYLIESGIHSCKIEASRKNMSVTAEIKIPNYQGVLDQNIKVKDEVVIKLGYNDELYEEFRGYVTEIKPNTPLVIHCEDKMFLLKEERVKAKSWKSVTLKKLLSDLVGQFEGEVPDKTYTEYRIKPDQTTAMILQELKDENLLDIFFQTNEGEGDIQLFAGYAYDRNEGTVDYHLQKNVPSNQTNLIFKRKGDRKVGVVGLSKQNDGSEIKVEKGDEIGEQIKIEIPGITKSELTTHVDHALKISDFEGYYGKIVSFGQPIVKHGMIANIIDEKFPERGGKYTIESVSVTYGPSGFRRDVELGFKL